MSLILDALKRAERERQADAVPAPGEVSVPIANRLRPRRRWWLIAFAIVVAGGAALGWKTWRGEPPRETPEVPLPAAAQPAPPVIVARPAPPLPAPAPTVVPGTEAVASLDDLTNEPILDAEPAPPGTPAAGATPAPAPTPVPAQPEPKAAPPPATVSPPPEAQAAQPPAPAAIPPALTQQAPLRKFREMPPDYRADFPALKIEIHVYERAQAQRFVMINGRKYREGERLAEGPSLIEIVPEGMVLEYRGEKVLYTLGR